MKLRTQKKIRAAIGYGVGGAFCFLLVLPLIWVASTSVRPISEMLQVCLMFERELKCLDLVPGTA